MSIWSQSDYDTLKSAYLELLTGTKVIQVSIGGKFVRYQDAQVGKIQQLLTVMAAELGLSVERAYAKPVGRFEAEAPE